MKYLRLQRSGGAAFTLGKSYKIQTEFFPLKNGEESEDSDTSISKDHAELCMKYGQGVVLFDDAFKHFNLKEVRKQVRDKMLADQNSLSKETISEVQALLSDCWTFTKFSK